MINTGSRPWAREREQLGEFLKQDGGPPGSPNDNRHAQREGHQNAAGVLGLTATPCWPASMAPKSELRMVGRSAGFWGAADRLTGH